MAGVDTSSVLKRQRTLLTATCWGEWNDRCVVRKLEQHTAGHGLAFFGEPDVQLVDPCGVVCDGRAAASRGDRERAERRCVGCFALSEHAEQPCIGDKPCSVNRELALSRLRGRRGTDSRNEHVPGQNKSCGGLQERFVKTGCHQMGDVQPPDLALRATRHGHPTSRRLRCRLHHRELQNACAQHRRVDAEEVAWRVSHWYRKREFVAATRKQSIPVEPIEYVCVLSKSHRHWTDEDLPLHDDFNGQLARRIHGRRAQNVLLVKPGFISVKLLAEAAAESAKHHDARWQV
eukprot:scaffold172_cov254-Pinguiococcus_pyrenoidosus.AAC.37